MPRGSRPEKVKEWASRLERFEGSKQTVAEFCRQEGVSDASLYLWRKKLRALRETSARTKRQAVGETSASIAFQAVQIVSPPVETANAKTVIQLTGGVRIQLGSDLPVVELIVKELFSARIETRSAATRAGALTC
jgi:transposase-like protein